MSRGGFSHQYIASCAKMAGLTIKAFVSAQCLDVETILNFEVPPRFMFRINIMIIEDQSRYSDVELSQRH